jgi:hypothetical protein
MKTTKKEIPLRNPGTQEKTRSVLHGFSFDLKRFSFSSKEGRKAGENKTSTQRREDAKTQRHPKHSPEEVFLSFSFPAFLPSLEKRLFSFVLVFSWVPGFLRGMVLFFYFFSAFIRGGFSPRLRASAVRS